MKLKSIVLVLTAGIMMSACSQDKNTFSLASQEQSSAQNFEIQKVDVLWVVDNSGSMKSSQEALAANFESFASKFIEKDFDFQMAITTTDAYKNSSLYRGGVMGRTTPNFVETFVDNVIVGLGGAGSERGLQSVESALSDTSNGSLVREGSQLAVIFVSDEDDESNKDNEYYLDYLKDLKQSTADNANFSVSAITIADQDCLSDVGTPGSVHKIGKRYIEMANATNGTVTSICDDFSESLKQISDKILNKTEKITLQRLPIIDTIRVVINGVDVPKADASLDVEERQGWEYLGATNEIIFRGDVVPSAAADFKIYFTPRAINQSVEDRQAADNSNIELI